MDSVTPKWAREAEEHLVKLSRRLDATEALCDELEAALAEVLAAWDMEQDTPEHNQQDRLKAAIEALRGLIRKGA